MQILKGKVSWFGGPNDHGVGPHEGLALFETSDLPHYPELFLKDQPRLTSGLARRLNPDAYYIACRWDYNQTPKSILKNTKVRVTNSSGNSIEVQPVDWGPNINTGRVADLSPGVFKLLNLQTDDVCEIIIP